MTKALALTALILAVLAAALAIKPRTARAQSGCSVASLNGSYGYTMTGPLYDNVGDLFFIAAAGKIAFDGGGNIAGTDTISFDGSIGHRTYTGTYTINADCTGSMNLVTADGNKPAADLVVVNAGKEVEFIQTNTDTVITGTAKQQ